MFQIVFQRAIRLDADLLQRPVIRTNCLARVGDLTIRQPAQVLHEDQLLLRLIDHAPVKCCTSAIFLGLGKLKKRVEGRACCPAENAGDQRAVVTGELLHRSGTVIGDLQKQRPTFAHNARQ